MIVTDYFQSYAYENPYTIQLADMFSGYKQSQAFVWRVLLELEKYLEKHEGRHNSLDNLKSWDSGDLHRLVTTFLGARFPMALALNKSDIPSARKYIQNVCDALPAFGAHIGVPMSSRKEMNFVRHHIIHQANNGVSNTQELDKETQNSPVGVWKCLQSAIMLREPVLVFPVSDMASYKPLPGMTEFSLKDPSLPNIGMISCLEAAGGRAPSLWDHEKKIYSPKSLSKHKNKDHVLRDVLTLRPGSTIEDVFSHLKWMGVISGEFVRCEGAGKIGEKPKLLKKDDVVGKHNRILKIMTTKRREWQKKI